MAYATTSIASRIEWCQRQRTQACAPRARAEWQAEEEGLWDAVFNRDHTTQYQQGPAAVFERYAMGLQDGRVMMRMTTAYRQVAPRTRTGGIRIPQRQTRNAHASHIR